MAIFRRTLVSFQLVLNLIVICSALNVIQSKYGILQQQQRADSGFYRTIPATSPQDCGVRCTMDPTCVGFSFRARIGPTDVNISQPCHLCNDRKTTFVPDVEYDYYGSCATDPILCKSNGRCEAYLHQNGTVKGYYCFCETLAPRSACQFNCIMEVLADYDLKGHDYSEEGGVNENNRDICGKNCAESKPDCQSAAYGRDFNKCFYKGASQYTNPSDLIPASRAGIWLYQVKCKADP